jgi:hypothetical protein
VVYNVNRRGPRTEPWGTPVESGTGSDRWELMETDCERLCKYEVMRERAVPEMPK